MPTAANAGSGRLAEQNRRLRVRLERLQRLFDAVEGYEASAEQPNEPVVSIPTREPPSSDCVPSIDDLDEVQREYVGDHDPRRRLLPYVGHANASAAELATACIGLNLIGAPTALSRNAVQQLQRTFERQAGHTFVCVTDDPDIRYFVKRGITFEFIGYAHLLHDPDWKAYFQLNMELLKRKYGIAEFVTIAADRPEAQ